MLPIPPCLLRLYSDWTNSHWISANSYISLSLEDMNISLHLHSSYHHPNSIPNPKLPPSTKLPQISLVFSPMTAPSSSATKAEHQPT